MGSLKGKMLAKSIGASLGIITTASERPYKVRYRRLGSQQWHKTTIAARSAEDAENKAYNGAVGFPLPRNVEVLQS